MLNNKIKLYSLYNKIKRNYNILIIINYKEQIGINYNYNYYYYL